MTNVVAITNQQQRKVKARASRQARVTRSQRRMHSVALVVGAVAVVLLGLSLDHLASGIQMITGSSQGEAWAMAVGIDLGFISLEMAAITMTEVVKRKVGAMVHHTLLALMVGSAGLNAAAFGLAAVGWFVYPAALLGAAIPVIIYRMGRAASAMYLH